MEPKKRHLFLSRFAYPPFNFKGGKAGRISTLTLKTNLLDVGFEGGETLTIRSDLELQPTYSAVDVLRVGDLVWLSEKLDDIALLAPALNDGLRNDFGVERSKKWQLFLERIRDFFKAREFIEVRTPTLVSSPGLEPFLDPFEVDFINGRSVRHMYLPTSPEFHLKKMLALGWNRIFEFKECFRNGELSQHHQPEFLMLEWYRAYAGFETMIQDVKDLMAFLQEKFAHKKLFESVQVKSVADLFLEKVGFKLTPTSTRDDLAELSEKIGVYFSKDDSFDDLFARIFLEKIEPSFSTGDPVIVKGYPPSQAALARIGLDGWAERFEIYWRGFELANAFHELNDPVEQRRRFEENIREKMRLKRAPVPIDEEFMSALERGMPPSVGIAAGVERLFMAFMGLENLNEARAFPILDV